MFVESVLLHLSVSTILALVLATMAGALTTWIAVFAIVTSILLAGGCNLWLKRSPGWGQPTRISGASGVLSFRQLSFPVWCLFLFIAFVIFRHSTHLLYYSDGWWKTLHPNNFGDLPLHMTYIRFLSSGSAFPPANPFYMTEALRYPIGMDLYNALWNQLGAPMMTHLFVVGLICFALMFFALYRWAGPWAWAGIFLNGGFFAWDFWAHPAGSWGASDLAWKNLFLSVLLTQRGFLFALPAGIVVLQRGYELLFKAKPLTRFQGLVYAWLWGVLPFFHIHTFMAVSLLLGVWALAKCKIKSLLPVATAAALVALPFLLYSTNFLDKAGVISWKLGWTLKEGENLALYWWKNFGPWLLLLLVLAYEVWRGKLKQWRPYFIGTVALLLTTQTLLFAPWDWDNIKVILWYYLALLPLLEVWATERLKVWQRDMAVSLLFISGTLALSWSLRNAWPGVDLYREEELNWVEQVLPKIPANAIIATADTFQHPVSYFGRGIVLGYAGHLWSHGIPSYEVRDAVDKIFRGEVDWKVLVERLGITHIYWGQREREKYGERGQEWQNRKNLSSVPGVGIYELQGE